MKNHVDVLIIGAGLSGVGAAVHLQRECPNKSYALLEARDRMGGTWDLFRYPGIRSDSDMYTLGYNFKPWRGEKSITDGPSILNYIKETAQEYGVDKQIRYGHKARKFSWCSEQARWTVDIELSSGEHTQMTCNFLQSCSGYYNYDQGYSPEFDGRDDFAGQIVHPQHWPENLDYKGKRVVVIGSGATAVTLIPSMSKDTAHITMLQRSPGYVVSIPEVDKLAQFTRKLLPEKLSYSLTRMRKILWQRLIYSNSIKKPEKARKMLMDQAREQLGPEFDVDKHFNPNYNPWEQRLCAVPDGDMFREIKAGRASVVTDRIDRFTETGIQLKSGEHLEADIIVTATGLNMLPLGGASLEVDGENIHLGEQLSYRGVGFSGVPNMVMTFGYINSSWTLKADLIAQYVCRLLTHMDKISMRQCTPRLREQDVNSQRSDWIDDFSAGYYQRIKDQVPQQGKFAPWHNKQYYREDKEALLKGPLEDGVMHFTNMDTGQQTSSTAEPMDANASASA